MPTSSTSARFTRTGRAYHLDIATAVDLRHALDLNETHWVATSAPIDTLHLDAFFLKLVDSDHDGRIKPRELKDSIRWCLEVFSDFRSLDAGDESLALATINTRVEDGKRAHEAATKLLLQQTDGAAAHVSLDQVRHVRRQTECMAVSEAGIVLPRATDDHTIRQFVEDLVPHTNVCTIQPPAGQPRRGKRLRMCSCPRISGEVVYRSVDGRLRGPRSWWGPARRQPVPPQGAEALAFTGQRTRNTRGTRPGLRRRFTAGPNPR